MSVQDLYIYMRWWGGVVTCEREARGVEKIRIEEEDCNLALHRVGRALFHSFFGFLKLVFFIYFFFYIFEKGGKGDHNDKIFG